MRKVTSIYFLVAILFLSCNYNNQNKNDSLFSKLEENITIKGNINNIVYDTINIKKFDIIKPKLDNKEFKKIIEDDLKKDLSEPCSDSNCDDQIVYTVVHSTPDFISIIKSEYYDNGYTSPSYYEFGINIMLYKQKLYFVEAKYSEKLRSEIMSFLRKNLEADCLDDTEIYENLALCFENGKAYAVNPLHSKTCDTNVEINFDSVNFKFVPIHQILSKK